jgi:hypothetical protein
MLAHVLSHEPAPFRGRRRQRSENRRGHDADDAFNLRRIVAARLDLKTMSRVPTLDWPSDLFADACAETAA